MSFLTAVRATLGPRVTLRPAYVAASGFHSSPARSALKETDQNRDEDLSNEYEAQKQDQLQSTKEGKGKWKQELASNSEASVKADRGEIDNESGDVKQMQEQTKHLPNRQGPVNKTQ